MLDDSIKYGVRVGRLIDIFFLLLSVELNIINSISFLLLLYAPVTGRARRLFNRATPKHESQKIGAHLLIFVAKLKMVGRLRDCRELLRNWHFFICILLFRIADGVCRIYAFRVARVVFVLRFSAEYKRLLLTICQCGRLGIRSQARRPIIMRQTERKKKTNLTCSDDNENSEMIERQNTFTDSAP